MDSRSRLAAPAGAGDGPGPEDDMREKLSPHLAFQYDKWDAFVNGRTGEQQMAWERRERARKAAEVIQAMDDTTRAVSDEELDAIRGVWQRRADRHMQNYLKACAERDALRAYAHMITAFAIEVAGRDDPATKLAIDEMQEVSGVAELMDTTTAT